MAAGPRLCRSGVNRLVGTHLSLATIGTGQTCLLAGSERSWGGAAPSNQGNGAAASSRSAGISPGRVLRPQGIGLDHQCDAPGLGEGEPGLHCISARDVAQWSIGPTNRRPPAQGARSGGGGQALGLVVPLLGRARLADHCGNHSRSLALSQASGRWAPEQIPQVRQLLWRGTICVRDFCRRDVGWLLTSRTGHDFVSEFLGGLKGGVAVRAVYQQPAHLGSLPFRPSASGELHN